MRSSRWLGAIGALLTLAFASPARALTVDEIVSRYVQARGGDAAIHAIRSLRITGKIRFGADDWSIESTFGEAEKRGGKMRVEMTRQGLTAVDAYDGADAWRLTPFGGRRDPFRVSADDAKWMIEEADMDGAIVDWRAKGNAVEYLGTRDVDGTQAHALRVRLKDGNVEVHYLDPDAFLDVRVETHRFARGAETVSETDFGAYEQVAGVWFPFTSESGRKGEPRTTHVTIERLEANVDVDDALFRFPAPNAKVLRAIEPGSGGTTLGAVAAHATPGARHAVVDSGAISGLGARNIGSAAMSGRVSAVAAYVEDGVTTLYVGAASGGVWKSSDGGTTFEPVFDDQPVQSIGAIAIDPSHPKTVWVGTGESWTRNSVSIGDGIYKSTDGGATWTSMGLPESERIARILVHPKNGDIVYACVPGKLWSDSPDRGVYKTTDGGKHWALILKGANLSTGCAGLAMDPKNPDVLFAGTWDFRRKGWTFRSGGEGPDAPSGSAMFRTADGGATWTKLAPATNGLPAGPWGRVEVEIAPSDPNVVYALVESKDSALYRSADGGRTWEKRDKSHMVVWRPFYFARLVIDPKNPNRLFKPDLQLIVSDDGGRSFAPSGGGAHGDWHDLWIDPTNPKHVVGGDDGGLWISHDGGSRWWKVDGLPISQFYHVSVDARDPYQVYGGLQDNSSWVGDSSYPSGITNHRWENLYFGDGFWTMVDPTDPDAVYAEAQGGDIGRVDRKTHATRNIKPRARYGEKLRFNWNAPIHASATQPGTIYIGAQFLFRSRDRGDTWERISPDLTTNDPQKQKQEQSGGVTVDNSYAEMHTTIYSISESPKDARVIWVGTDDGNLQLSRDAGQHWTNVIGNVKWLPKSSWVSWVEASRFDAGTAYVAFDRHTAGDMEPWVYKTTDFGKTFTRIIGPWHGVRGYAHVIKEDTVKPSLLFCGTELGLWISVDGGGHWAAFKGGHFPSVAVRDLQVQPREADLVVATHGRGIWIVDDLAPLRAMTPDVLARDAAFLPVRPVQERMQGNGGWSNGDAAFVGQNPPGGAVITYYQATRHLYGPLKLEVLDASGKVIDTLDASTRRGINRITWSMQTKAPRVPRAAEIAWGASRGPRVLPGTYTLRLTGAGEPITTKLEIALDRRAPYTIDDRKAQLDAVMSAHALFGEMSEVVDRLDTAHAAAEQRASALKAGDPLAAKLRGAAHALEETKKKIVATKEGGAITGEERIREHLDQLYSALVEWEGRPARYQVEAIEALRRELEDAKRELDREIQQQVKPLDGELRARGLAPIPTEVAERDADDDDDEADEADAELGPAIGEMLQCAASRGGASCEAATRALRAARAMERERD